MTSKLRRRAGPASLAFALVPLAQLASAAPATPTSSSATTAPPAPRTSQAAAPSQAAVPSQAVPTLVCDPGAFATALRAAHRELAPAPPATASAAAAPSGAPRPPARRGALLTEEIHQATAVDAEGAALRSAKVVNVQSFRVREGETLRVLAYRYMTSPLALAALNGIRWDAEDDSLEPGTTLQVPISVRPATAFGDAARLVSGPGVRVDRPHHAWGRPHAVQLLQSTFAAVGRTWPGRHPFIVHDVSRLGGGRLGGHKSHRGGQDIDIGYPTREANRADWGNPPIDDIDYERLWFVVDRFERSGLLAAAYMAPAIQRRLYAHAIAQGADPARLQVMFQYPGSPGQKAALIRHAKGHRDHMHLRFLSPVDLPELRS